MCAFWKMRSHDCNWIANLSNIDYRNVTVKWLVSTQKLWQVFTCVCSLLHLCNSVYTQLVCGWLDLSMCAANVYAAIHWVTSNEVIISTLCVLGLCSGLTVASWSHHLLYLVLSTHSWGCWVSITGHNYPSTTDLSGHPPVRVSSN